MKYLVMLVLVLFVGCGSDSSVDVGSALEDDSNSTFIYKGENTKNKIEGVLLYGYSNLADSPQFFSNQKSFDLFLGDANISRNTKIISSLKNINVDFEKENILLFPLVSSGCGFSQIIISSSVDNVAIEPKRLHGVCNAIMLYYDVVCLVSKDIRSIDIDGLNLNVNEINNTSDSSNVTKVGDIIGDFRVWHRSESIEWDPLKKMINKLPNDKGYIEDNESIELIMWFEIDSEYIGNNELIGIGAEASSGSEPKYFDGNGKEIDLETYNKYWEKYEQRRIERNNARKQYLVKILDIFAERNNLVDHPETTKSIQKLSNGSFSSTAHIPINLYKDEIEDFINKNEGLFSFITPKLIYRVD